MRKPITKLCEWCTKPFQSSHTEARFCSRICWFSFHRGQNHRQYHRIETHCLVCGKVVLLTKTQFNRGKLHYCSWKCSGQAHRNKISGNKNANWRGGALQSRGPSWQRIRHEVRQGQGFKCAICGMSDDDHRIKYKRALTVHHKEPYRLNFNNDFSNLVALCVSDHAKEEAKSIRALSPEQKAIIRHNTERVHSLGLDKHQQIKVPCPRCGRMKRKSARHCWDCKWDLERIANKSKHTCKNCGMEKSCHAKLCRTCWVKQNGKPSPIKCLICNVQLRTARATLCHPCSLKLKNKLSAKTKHYTTEGAIAEIKASLN